MMDKKIDLKIFVPPVVACNYEKSWKYAVDMVQKRLEARFGDIFELEMIVLLSLESFEYPEIIDGLQQKKFEPPIITLNGEVIKHGGKLSEGFLRRIIEEELARKHPDVLSDSMN